MIDLFVAYFFIINIYLIIKKSFILFIYIII